jgi:hypothetical protein
MQDRVANEGSIDLAIFDTKTQADKGFELDILHVKTREPTGFRIRILGMDSATMQDFTRELEEQALEHLRNDQRRARSTAEIEETALQRIIAATTGWTEGALFFGEVFPFSRENARKLYTDPRVPEIREQVERGIRNRANFLPGNGTSS